MPLPGLGYVSGDLRLKPEIAPKVSGNARPFSPGEYMNLPDNGGWASEMSVTVPHPTEAGKYTNVPSLWLIDGKPVRVNEDMAGELAKQSGLTWPTWNTSDEADAVSAEREKNWQSIRPEDAAKVDSLWSKLK